MKPADNPKDCVHKIRFASFAVANKDWIDIAWPVSNKDPYEPTMRGLLIFVGTIS